MNQKIDLNKIFDIASSSSDKSNRGKIEAILEQCSKQICVEFAYKVCLDVKHLMEDKRSLIAIEAVKQYLDTGKRVSEEIVASAAASASSSSSVASSASSAASYAASVAASYAASATIAASYVASATIAASSAAYAYYISHTRLEKDKQYLQLLIELIASSCSCEENRFLHEIM